MKSSSNSKDDGSYSIKSNCKDNNLGVIHGTEGSKNSTELESLPYSTFDIDEDRKG